MTTLWLEGPFFWTETRDPECWLRGLDVLIQCVEQGKTLQGAPRSIWSAHLRKVFSRRSTQGLFALSHVKKKMTLLGAGLLEQNPDTLHWSPSPQANVLVSSWKKNLQEGLEQLGSFLVQESIWLRLLLSRLLLGDWTLPNWTTAKLSQRGLAQGKGLVLHRASAPEEWFDGMQNIVGGRWLEKSHCDELGRSSSLLRAGKKSLFWVPLRGPLYLLESLGWLRKDGSLSLPKDLEAELRSTRTASDEFFRITQELADLRGFVAIEPALRLLLSRVAQIESVDEPLFVRWMDQLTQSSLKQGAIELLEAAAGQARHGRGLSGDREQKLVRMVVYPEFNNVFQQSLEMLSEIKTEPRKQS
jgi:hypothetical protein